jgi:hypothetical protein
MFVLGIIGVVLIGWGLYALVWDAWKARRAKTRISICIAGIIAIGIGYLFAAAGFS